MGMQKVAAGDIPQAKEWYKRGLQNDPDNKKVKAAWKQLKNIEKVRTLGNENYKA